MTHRHRQKKEWLSCIYSNVEQCTAMLCTHVLFIYTFVLVDLYQCTILLYVIVQLQWPRSYHTTTTTIYKLTRFKFSSNRFLQLSQNPLQLDGKTKINYEFEVGIPVLKFSWDWERFWKECVKLVRNQELFLGKQQQYTMPNAMLLRIIDIYLLKFCTSNEKFEMNYLYINKNMV